MNIIGKGMGWENAPRDGESWGITQLILRRPVDRVIDMNDYSLWGPVEAEEAAQARQLAGKRNVEYIDLETYPLRAVIERFKTDYFSSTVDYAIALALLEGYTKLDLYGVNMANATEYAYQKPGADFWCGVAKGMGVEISVHGAWSSLMKTQDNLLYGYGTLQGELV